MRSCVVSTKHGVCQVWDECRLAPGLPHGHATCVVTRHLVPTKARHSV